MSVVWVACAIIEHQGQVLAARRKKHHSQGGLWEFPGGKLNQGETPEQCLIREIMEELGANIRIVARLPDCLYHYPALSVCLMPFVCQAEQAAIFQAIEHDAIQWCTKEELLGLDWCPADVPVLQQYLAWKSAKKI
ncbi:MAG: (deoxy)nucleoside triphosphate pyrophosphohydrolase [Cytophagales bacterium]|nr:(deoxy)nucleoside triphosphate pyrophosphohydrolase [Bernardetiaceae bacterium]MDW8204598.1 (deoxy)nucleoside triphosphate pyrophosphohydrolase [Cytophagales bacterium]